MYFDTSMIAPLPPERGCIEGVEEQSPYGTADIKFDHNGHPVDTSLDVAFDNLDMKLIEFYGESFRRKLNFERTKRGQKPL